MKQPKYIKLSDVEHCLARPGLYIGDIHDIQQPNYMFLNGKFSYEENANHNPGILKIFDEIVSNSVDESKRNKKLNKIDIDISMLTGEITVYDNGGIPVKKHKEYGVWIPELIFSELRAGSNFDDSEKNTVAGQNGLGSTLTNIYSNSFTIFTCDGKKSYKQTFTDNMGSSSKPIINQSTARPGTTIVFTPDWDFFNSDINTCYESIRNRVFEIAGCNPNIKVYLNNELLKIHSFTDYVKLFEDEFVCVENDDWTICVGASDKGFEHISFVNGTRTSIGGTHIDFILQKFVNQIRAYIKKKYKVDVKPSDVKSQLRLFINSTIINPRYSSQTKENLITQPKDFGSDITIDDKFIKKLIASSVINNIIEWVLAKQKQQELADLRKLNKKSDPNGLKKILKFDDATSKNRRECMVLFTEGDSAATPIRGVRDPKTTAIMPLRGKMMNVRGMSYKDVLKNEEIKNILTIIGLKLGEELKDCSLRFGKVVIAADADMDGQHIIGLFINFISVFFPELILNGILYKLNTPIIIVRQGKNDIEFFSESEFHKFEKETTKKYTSKYYKGLGGFSNKQFKEFLNNDKYIERIEVDSLDDLKILDLTHNKSRAEDRKRWILGD